MSLTQLKIVQNKKWKKVTGIEAVGTRFSIIIPIHNEKNFLASVLATPAIANIPFDARVNVLLITNGCTDNGASERIIRKFMLRMGKIEEKIRGDGVIPVDISDPLSEKGYTQTAKGNIRFIHINTPVQSKTNALNIGNQIASHFGDPIAICLDANCFPDTDAIALLYKRCHKAILENPGEAVVLSGSYRNYPNKGEKIMGLSPIEFLSSYIGIERICTGNKERSVKLIGAIMGWDVEWWKRNGGIPQTIMDDMAMRVIAVVKKQRVIHVANAQTWRYTPNTVRDRVKMLVRYARGALQIQQMGIDYADAINTSCFFMNGDKELNKALTKWSEQNPGKEMLVPRIEKLWKRIISVARKQYKLDPMSRKFDGIKGMK